MKFIIASLISLLSLTGANAQNITFNADTLYPEGTAYSKKQDVFFVSSIRHGIIGKVDRKGTYTPFITDPELVTSVGILANEEKNLLYVAIADNGASVNSNEATKYKLSKVAAYDLTTGKRKFIADLGTLNPNAANLVNDLAQDEKGNLYATNSFSPIIFKITQDGKPSIFAKNDIWKGEGFNLNGIVYSKKGYLITAQYSTGKLFKVNIANPEDVTLIDAPILLKSDGLILNDKNELVVITNGTDTIYKLTSNDNWKSAQITDSQKSSSFFPTTGVIAKGKYYILNAKLSELFDPKAEKTSDFVLQQINFSK